MIFTGCRSAWVLFVILCCSFQFHELAGQVLTAEDSLQAGIKRDKSSAIAGYGEAFYQYDATQHNANAGLNRNVLFVGYKFNTKFSLFTELEIENAVVSSTKLKASIGMEQAFVKMNLNSNHYVVAGLFIPRLGIINENHLSTTFNSVFRPVVETIIIPSTWREIGVGYYGQLEQLDNLYIAATVQNGLNSEGFSLKEGIRDGRQSGYVPGGVNLGHTLSLLYYKNNFRFQTSHYFGGSTGIQPRVADSLGLNKGMYANPVLINEADIQYLTKELQVKLLGAYTSIFNAENINTVYANNTPSKLYGAYLEIAYNVLHQHKIKKLWTYIRQEFVNTNFRIPYNGIKDESNNRKITFLGLTYKPIHGIALKGEYVYTNTGQRNEGLVVSPFPQVLPYYTQQHQVRFGIAYNF